MAEATKSGVAAGFQTGQEVIDFCRQQGVKFLDIKFIDVPGTWQHLTVPISELEDSFTRGLGFDGSSIRGFQHIHESDMLLVADPKTAFLDPFTAIPTISVTCNVKDPSGASYDRDPRYIAQRAENYLRDTGIATDSARVSRSAQWARLMAKPCLRLFAGRPMPDLRLS